MQIVGGIELTRNVSLVSKSHLAHVTINDHHLKTGYVDQYQTHWFCRRLLSGPFMDSEPSLHH
jgi:hypothetical protein